MKSVGKFSHLDKKSTKKTWKRNEEDKKIGQNFLIVTKFSLKQILLWVQCGDPAEVHEDDQHEAGERDGGDGRRRRRQSRRKKLSHPTIRQQDFSTGKKKTLLSFKNTARCFVSCFIICYYRFWPQLWFCCRSYECLKKYKTWVLTCNTAKGTFDLNRIWINVLWWWRLIIEFVDLSWKTCSLQHNNKLCSSCSVHHLTIDFAA